MVARCRTTVSQCRDSKPLVESTLIRIGREGLVKPANTAADAPISRAGAAAEQDCGPRVLVPRRLENAQCVNTSIDAPKYLLTDQPCDLAVVEAEADQLRAR